MVIGLGDERSTTPSFGAGTGTGTRLRGRLLQRGTLTVPEVGPGTNRATMPAIRPISAGRSTHQSTCNR